MLTAETSPDIDIGALIKADRIHGRVYYDDAIFRMEMEEIWHKIWVYVGHESEVPRPGDYVRRNIGLQPVIMLRGSDGAVRVFFNRCRHRANLLCFREQGNAPELLCPYHGWVYSNNGDLVAPSFGEAYAPSLPLGEFGLVPLPRLQSYRGLVFGSASADGIGLDEHLGEARKYLDLTLDQSPLGEVELSAGVQRARYRGNWKMLPENSLEGAYHGHFIHKFMFDLADRRAGRNRPRTGRDRAPDQRDEIWSLPGGHMVQEFGYRNAHSPGKEPNEVQKAYLRLMEAAHGAERAREVTGQVLPPMYFIFPNLIYIRTHFRRVEPVGVDDTLVYYHPMMLKGVPPEINTDILRDHEGSFGPAGFLAPDDLLVCERNQVGVQAQGDEWLFLGRGIHREKHYADGGTSGHIMDENQLRGLWRHYARLMTGQGA